MPAKISKTSHLVRRKSDIHGYGLFTKVNIKKDALIGHCEVREVEEPSPHTLWCDAGLYEVRCKLKYINHSKKPNVIYYDDFTVFALRDIQPDEELTHFYGEEWD